MVELGRLVAFLVGFLDVESFEESAINGLQVDGSKKCWWPLPWTASWQPLSRRQNGMPICSSCIMASIGDINGRFVGRIIAESKLADASCALYVAHLPLDAHPVVGHAAVLLQILGVDPQTLRPFGNSGGQTPGFSGKSETRFSRSIGYTTGGGAGGIGFISCRLVPKECPRWPA